MLADFLDSEKNWFSNPTVVSSDTKDQNGNFVTHYLIPFDQAIRFLEMYQMFYVWEGDINLKELRQEPKYQKKEKKFKITSIPLIDWLDKYNIEYTIMNDQLYVFTSDLVKYTKSRYHYSVWNKLGDAKLIQGPRSDRRENHTVVRINDAIKCLKKSDVIDEFPEITTPIKIDIINATDKQTPIISIGSVKQTGGTLCISLNIEKDYCDELKRIV